MFFAGWMAWVLVADPSSTNVANATVKADQTRSTRCRAIPVEGPEIPCGSAGELFPSLDLVHHALVHSGFQYVKVSLGHSTSAAPGLVFSKHTAERSAACLPS